MPEFNQPLLINILGHAGGALIFAIFLVLLYSGRGWSGVRGRYLPAAAAILSLLWNAGSLAVLTLPRLSPRALEIVVALSFSFLSLLPAVLLHHYVGDRYRLAVMAGYALSGVAVVMHFREIGGYGVALHQSALMLITIGFLLLTLVVVLLPSFRAGGGTQAGGTRLLAAMSLALFATSFVHFGAGHAGQAWSSELVLHHAGIPLALFVLLQDYRFILLDAFVRFLANALLAAVLTGIVIAAAFRLVLVERVTAEPSKEALLLLSVCLFLVFFAWLRNRVQALLTQAVFRHGNLGSLSAAIHNCPPFSNEDEYLAWAVSHIAAAVR